MLHEVIEVPKPSRDPYDTTNCAANVRTLAGIAAELNHEMRLAVEAATPAMRHVGNFEQFQVLLSMIIGEAAKID